MTGTAIDSCLPVGGRAEANTAPVPSTQALVFQKNYKSSSRQDSFPAILKYVFYTKFIGVTSQGGQGSRGALGAGRRKVAPLPRVLQKIGGSVKKKNSLVDC